MFQLEFAKRLVASPGGKEYGSLSLLIRYNATVSPLFELTKDSFYPKPKIAFTNTTIPLIWIINSN